MNIFELLTFLVVTGSVGAGVGAIVGLFTGHVAPGAKQGTLLGPIVGAVLLTIWAASIRVREKLEKNKNRTSH